MPRLRHEVARALAGRYSVLFAETPFTWRDRRPTVLEEVEPSIIRCRLGSRANLPERVRRHVPGANDFVQARLLREIRRSLEELGWAENAVLVNFNHDATRIVESEGVFSAKLYLSNDDWVAKAPGRAARRVVARQEARVARAADACLAVSHPLVEGLRQHNPHTRLFLPGHDFDLPPRGAPTGRSSSGSVRVLFMGNVNRRVETEWLRAVARAEDMEMHVLGTVTIDAAVVEGLRVDGVLFHPPLQGTALQQALLEADVLVIPYHLHEDVVAVTASNKLFKYIAAEKPVVISDMPHFIEFGPGIIYRARDPEEFVAQIHQATLEDNAALRHRRREIAREAHWDTRARELDEIITSLSDRRRP